MSAFSGIYPYLPTPVDEDGNPLQPVVHQVVDRALAGGVHGLSPLGSSGEVVYLEETARAQLIEYVLNAADNRVPVIPGISGFSTRQLVREARRAEQLGSAGVVLVLPSYFPLSSMEIRSACTAVSQAVNVPVVLYHQPKMCGFTLSAETVRELNAECGIGYIKDASGEIGNIPRWLAACEGKLRMFAATAVSPTAALLLGAVGWMSGPASVFPAESVAIHEHAAAGRWERARAIETTLQPALELFRALGPSRAVKAMLAADGVPIGHPIPPQAPIDAAERERAEACIKAIT